MKLKIIVFVITLMFLSSCAMFRKDILKISREDMKNAEVSRQVARNWLSTWQINSGIIRLSFKQIEGVLPCDCFAKVDRLDALSQKDAEGHCVLELHASPGFLSLESIMGFTKDGRMSRIPGTLMEFAELLPILEKELASHVRRILSPKMADFAKWAASQIGFDVREITEELPGRLERLGRRNHTIFALEVPGRWIPLEENHPMYDFYFFTGLENTCVKDASQFEHMYSTNRMESEGFTQNAVDAAAYVITPKKPVS